MYNIAEKKHEYMEDVCMYRDYYIGGGKQWKENEWGLVTRSGKSIYDIEPIYNYNRQPGRQVTEQEQINANSRTRKVYEWAEMNVIRFAIDEKARTVRGVGETVFTMPTAPEVAEETFNAWWQVQNGEKFIQDIAKATLRDGLSFFSVLPMDRGGTTVLELFVYPLEEMLKMEDGSIVRSYEAEDEDGQTYEYMEVHTNNEIIFYRNQVELERVEHNWGMNDIICLENVDGVSDVYGDIPYQDMINGLLTRFAEVTKQHLSPALAISSDHAVEAMQQAQARNSEFKLERGAGSIIVMDKEGKLQYHEWQGVPQGAFDVFNEYKKYFLKTKGINIFDDVAVPESGTAMREARRSLYNSAQDFRDILTEALQQLVNVYFARLTGSNLNILTRVKYGDMVVVSEKEIEELNKMKLENSLIKYNVHQNKEKFFLDIGYTQDEINFIAEDPLLQLEG